MERTLILGAYGRLGRLLQATTKNLDHEIYLQGRQKYAKLCFDPTDTQSLCGILSDIKPDNIINLVALTDIGICHGNPELAYLVNAKISQDINEFVSNKNHKSDHTFLIQISTDQVYQSPFPNKENQAVPSNVYGLTKMLGEASALMCGGTAIRTNYIGASPKSNMPSLTDWIVASLKSRRKIQGFNNVFINALHSSSLCEYIKLVLFKKKPGVFNVGTSSTYSKADIIKSLGKQLKLQTDTVKFGPADFPDKVERPTDMSMDVSKFEKIYEENMPDFNIELKKLSADYI